jgi:hypothetical protein
VEINEKEIREKTQLKEAPPCHGGRPARKMKMLGEKDMMEHTQSQASWCCIPFFS